jgi:hypothetical protein
MRPNIKQIVKDCKQLITEGRDSVSPLKQMFEENVFKPEDFSLKDVLIESMGYEAYDMCDPRREINVSNILEADGVDSTTFSNITGQIVFSKILQAFDNPDLVATALIPTTPTRLDGEKLPGVAQLGDKGDVVKEGMPYPNKGMDEEYIETPQIDKRGFIVPVTKEAVFFDRTNLVLQRASQVGESLALGKEKRIIDSILGEATTFATGGTWSWKGTNTYAVYNSSAVNFSTTWYVNLQTAVLNEYLDLDVTENLFSDMKDPTTQEPVLIPGVRDLLVVPNLRQTANRIVNSIETRNQTGTTRTTISPGDKGDYRVISSPFFKTRLASNKTTSWWVGNFSKAFTYMENWPITVSQAPTNNEAEFTSDIIARYKASEKGQIAVMAPHYVIKSTGAGS